MTHTPPVEGAVGATAAHEPLWAVAFPVYYAITFGYGLFATLKPIVALQGSGPADATGAQLFGLLVLVASVLGLAGSLRTVFRRVDGLEMFGSGAFVLMMLVYFATLTVLITMMDPNTRPGSSFVPLGFMWFPLVRGLVIVRDRRRRRRKAAA